MWSSSFPWHPYPGWVAHGSHHLVLWIMASMSYPDGPWSPIIESASWHPCPGRMAHDPPSSNPLHGIHVLAGWPMVPRNRLRFMASMSWSDGPWFPSSNPLHGIHVLVGWPMVPHHRNRFMASMSCSDGPWSPIIETASWHPCPGRMAHGSPSSNPLHGIHVLVGWPMVPHHRIRFMASMSWSDGPWSPIIESASWHPCPGRMAHGPPSSNLLHGIDVLAGWPMVPHHRIRFMASMSWPDGP